MVAESTTGESPAHSATSSESQISDMRLEGEIPSELRAQNVSPGTFQSPEQLQAMITASVTAGLATGISPILETILNLQRQVNRMSGIQEEHQFNQTMQSSIQSPRPQQTPPRGNNHRGNRIHDHEPIDRYSPSTTQYHDDALPPTAADMRHHKEPRAYTPKFTPGTENTGSWLYGYTLWAETQFIGAHPRFKDSRIIESFGASMGTADTKNCFVIFLNENPRALPKDLFLISFHIHVGQGTATIRVIGRNVQVQTGRKRNGQSLQ